LDELKFRLAARAGDGHALLRLEELVQDNSCGIPS